MTQLITAILDFISGLLDSMLPVYDLSSSYYDNISSSIITITDFLKQANFLIPLPDIVLMVSIDIGIRLFKMALFVGNWVVRRVLDVVP